MNQPSFMPLTSQHMSQAAIDVLAERRRQIEAEGFGADIDRKYDRGELTRAAATYALSFLSARVWDGLRSSMRNVIVWLWPWDGEWFKPNRGRRDLVKAAALLLAEIEREDRLFAELRGKHGTVVIDDHRISTHAAEFPREPDWDPQS